MISLHLDVRDKFVAHVQKEISPDQLQNAEPCIFDGNVHKLRYVHV